MKRQITGIILNPFTYLTSYACQSVQQVKDLFITTRQP